MNEQEIRNAYKEALSDISAPPALVGKVMDMTENNEIKARPKTYKRAMMIAMALVAVLVVTVVSVAIYDVDYLRDIVFGNKVDETYFESIDGAIILKDEYAKELTTIKPGDLIFDIPNIIVEENIAIPEKFELTYMDSRTLEEQNYSFTSTVNYYYDSKEERVFDGNKVVLTNNMSLHITEIVGDSGDVVITHDGEMLREQTADGRIDIYYYHEKLSNGIATHYLIVGEKYTVKIFSLANTLETEDQIYLEHAMLTLDEIKAIAESIDKMFYPE